ncbi:hypothetical protein YC2023_054607 [Brassica napus]
MSGDESEDNGNSVATESDFEDIFDENFQPDFYCSSRENTDSESEPEIEVVDLTVDTAPDTMIYAKDEKRGGSSLSYLSFFKLFSTYLRICIVFDIAYHFSLHFLDVKTIAKK